MSRCAICRLSTAGIEDADDDASIHDHICLGCFSPGECEIHQWPQYDGVTQVNCALCGAMSQFETVRHIEAVVDEQPEHMTVEEARVREKRGRVWHFVNATQGAPQRIMTERHVGWINAALDAYEAAIRAPYEARIKELEAERDALQGALSDMADDLDAIVTRPHQIGDDGLLIAIAHEAHAALLPTDTAARDTKGETE